MARRVGNDELALVGREISVRNVDRDALLPLVLEPIGKQREIDFLAGRPVARTVLLDGRKLILVDHLRFIEQPPDQRALAVIYAPASDKPEQLLALVLREVFVD